MIRLWLWLGKVWRNKKTKNIYLFKIKKTSIHTTPTVKIYHCIDSVVPCRKSMAEEVDNKQIIFRGYIEGNPRETDMEFKVGNKMKMEAPKGSGAMLVKNLYLSCDPYMRGRMRNFHGSYIPPFVPGSVMFFTLLIVQSCCMLLLQVFENIFLIKSLQMHNY